MQDKIDTVREIALAINTLELRAADTFEKSLAVMVKVVEGRKRLSLPPSFATAALSRAAAATSSYAEAHRLIAEAHRELADDQEALGVPRMGGDVCPWPNMRDGAGCAPTRHLAAVG